jgi:phage antirepressor YoqD-like protein
VFLAESLRLKDEGGERMSTVKRWDEGIDNHELARLAVDMIHRTIVHHVLWFKEVEHQKGFEAALDILDAAYKRSYGIQMNRLAKFFGFEMVDGVPKPLLDLPREKLLELENAQHKQIIGELRPKASYYDLILQNKSLVPISKIAKDYGMSGKAFNKLLHELGVQYKMGDTWLLYQQYADQGYTLFNRKAQPINNGFTIIPKRNILAFQKIHILTSLHPW